MLVQLQVSMCFTFHYSLGKVRILFSIHACAVNIYTCLADDALAVAHDMSTVLCVSSCALAVARVSSCMTHFDNNYVSTHDQKVVIFNSSYSACANREIRFIPYQGSDEIS